MGSATSEGRFKKGAHSDSPVYLSNKMTEYFIELNKSGYYIIRAFKGAVVAELSGMWITKKDCERALISWLEKDDKYRGRCRYPGAKNRVVTEYTKRYLNESSTDK